MGMIGAPVNLPSCAVVTGKMLAGSGREAETKVLILRCTTTNNLEP